MPLDSAERKPPLRGDAAQRLVIAALRGAQGLSVAAVANRAGISAPVAAATLHALWEKRIVMTSARLWRLRRRRVAGPKNQAIRERLLRDLADGEKSTPDLCGDDHPPSIHKMLCCLEREGLVVRTPHKASSTRPGRAADIWKLAQPPFPARASDDVEVQPHLSATPTPKASR